ncbi:hypothetical protein J6Y73_02925 [bacterium]|nr:hypothetical protein [bacterium]
MQPQVLIIFILSIISNIILCIFKTDEKNKNSLILNIIELSLLSILAIVSLISSIGGINEELLIYGILMTVNISLYAIKDIVVLVMNHKELIDDNLKRKIDIYSSLSFYVLSSIIIIIYSSMTFITMIVMMVLALIFFSSIYLIKRREWKDTVILFFIYSLVISFFLSIPLTGIFYESNSESRTYILAFLTVGASLIYLISIFKYGDLIFETYPKNKNIINRIETFIYNQGLIFMALSISYILILS